MNRISGFSWLLVSISRSRPLKTPGALWKASSASAVGASWALRGGGALWAGMPGRGAAAIVGEVSARARAPGCSAVKKRAESSRKGGTTASATSAVSRVSLPLLIVSWMKGRETRAKAPKVRSRATKRLACVSGTGGTGGVGGSRGGPKAGEVGTRGGERAQHRHAAFGQPAQLTEGGIELGPAAGKGGAETGLVALDRLPRRLVEHVEELVDVDRFGPRRGGWDGVAGGEAARRVAGDDLQVLEAQRRLRADDHPRVDRQRFGALVESQLELGFDGPVFLLHRRHRAHDADPGTADPHLVAANQRVGVGHAGGEVVSGDEGQAVVGVVGEKDGDDHDQHGDRADDGRAARNSLYAAGFLHGARRQWRRPRGGGDGSAWESSCGPPPRRRRAGAAGAAGASGA